MMDVKLLRIVTGEEVVAEVIEWTGGMLTIKNGLVVLPSADGRVGFMPWATVIDQTQPEINLDMKHIVYVAEVDEGVKKKYNSMYGSKLVTPDEKKLIL